MYLPDFELHEARSLEEASDLLGRYAPEARLLAGGTDLLVDLRTRRYRTGHVISLEAIPELRGIDDAGGDGLGIGAMTSITGLAGSAVLRKRWPAILDAALRMASHQVRNRATVGGNIGCAAPCADLPPILIVMNASIVLRSAGGERTLPLESFFTGPRETVIAPDEVLTTVRVPEPADRSGSAYARFSLREGNAIPVAGVAAGLRLNDDGTIGTARIAMGAVAPTPRLVPSAAGILEGAEPSDEAFSEAADRAMAAAEPITDVRGSADYRRGLVGVLTRRALARALERARGPEGGGGGSSSDGRAAGDGASRHETPGGTAS